MCRAIIRRLLCRLTLTMCQISETWPKQSPEWTSEDYDELMRAQYKEDQGKVTVQQIVENSDRFPIDFPIDSVRCKSLKTDTPESLLEENINSVYPVVHEHSLKLYAQFLRHKRNFGSKIEKEVYRDMTLDGLVDRFLSKRAVAFLGSCDQYMLLDGLGRVGGWEKVGTPQEEEPLLLKQCLSYDEIKLSALLSVSSATRFINIGDRNNCGLIETNKNKIETNGIIVGLIGARLEKPGVMEYQEIIVTKDQTTNELTPSVKDLFLNFYEESPALFDLEDETRFSMTRSGNYFNNLLFQKRLALSIDTLLIEANSRAKDAGKMAYVHVVGIGLGVWKISPVQNALFMDAFAKRIEYLSTPNLDCIADICFSYIGHSTCGKYKNGDTFPLENHENNGIRIHIINRDPHEKLSGPSKGNLLVVSYAWDGNALPGNEFWLGSLAASGDPAAAASTQVSELHNAHINPKVCGSNLRVATTKGLLTLSQYQDVIRKNQQKPMTSKLS